MAIPRSQNEVNAPRGALLGLVAPVDDDQGQGREQQRQARPMTSPPTIATNPLVEGEVVVVEGSERDVVVDGGRVGPGAVAECCAGDGVQVPRAVPPPLGPVLAVPFMASNFGAPQTLVEQSTFFTNFEYDDAALRSIGVDRSTIRLALGYADDTDQVIADLARALDRSPH
jgi:hypothetical protein